MDGEIAGKLMTLVLFGAIGAYLARFLKLPVPVRTWLLLLAAVVVGSFVGVNTRVVSVFGVAILLNWAIASCCLGVLVGLFVRTVIPNRAPRRTA